MGVLSSPMGYLVFDADNHYYEPVDLFVRFIEPEFADRTFSIEERDGDRVVMFQGRPFGFIGGEGNKQRIRPGSLRALLRGEAVPEEDEEDENDSYASDPAARIELMDRQGIEATLMFPSTGVTIANAIGQDPALLAAHMRAFNRWLQETWSFDYEHRIFSPAVIDLADPDAAVAELDTVMSQGARAVQLLPGPALWSTPDAPGRSPAHPVYDPFWARVDEAQILVTLHLGNSGYMEHYSADWGESSDPDGVRGSDWGSPVRTPDHAGGRSAFQWAMLYRDRPIMDTLAALIFHNLFGRFPNVQVASVENGSVWVPYLLRAMDNMKGMARNGPWPNGYVNGRPSEIFRRHVYVSPHHYGEDVDALIDLLGVERVLYGSDFPHAEGMSGVDDYQERAGEFAARLDQPPEVTRDVMRDNGLGALRLTTA